MSERSIRRTCQHSATEPIRAHFGKHTPKAIVAEVLEQAGNKSRANDVAQYLVAARLQLLIGKDAVRSKDGERSLVRGAFRFGKAFIDVTVRKPHKRQIEQVTHLLRERTMRVWLIVTLVHRAAWHNAIEQTLDVRDRSRIVVTDIETYLCQSVYIQGRFEPAAENTLLKGIFETYNERLPSTGASDLRIHCINTAG